jgi:hypothetical protein
MILIAAGTSVFAIAVTQFTKRFDRKPFNCELCMSFWLSLFVGYMSQETIQEAIAFTGIAVFTRQLLWKVWPTMF